jgi:hypothetical protein
MNMRQKTPNNGLLRAAYCPAPRVLAVRERTRRCRSAPLVRARGQGFCASDLSACSVLSGRLRDHFVEDKRKKSEHNNFG